MREAAKALEFEKAAQLRDRLKKLRSPRVRARIGGPFSNLNEPGAA